MKALAEALLDEGASLSGSDQSIDPQSQAHYASRGVEVSVNHDPQRVTTELDLLVYSAAIPETNPERQRARELDIDTISYPEAIGRLSRHLKTVAVAGTHGKSSTTAQIVALLQSAGWDPSYLCGAERVIDGRSGHSGTDHLLIVEACEYRRHFLALEPDVICLLGIEPDHFDCFPLFEDAIAAYQGFIQRLSENGCLFYNADCPVTRQLAKSCRVETLPIANTLATFGSTVAPGESALLPHQSGVRNPQLPLAMHERFNLRAAATVVNRLEIDWLDECVQERLWTPVRLKRRFEIKTHPSGWTVIDDYAHHPTEIRATLTAARMRYPQRRLVCCFQPHQVSRTQQLKEEFVDALCLADRVYLLPVFAARESPSSAQLLESEKLAAQLHRRGVAASVIPSLDQVWSTLETDAPDSSRIDGATLDGSDVVLTLGAGDLSRLHHDRT